MDEIDEDWCRIGKYWIKRSDLVPLNDAAIYYTNVLFNGGDKYDATGCRAAVWKAKGEYTKAFVDHTTCINIRDTDDARMCRATDYYKLKLTENALADLQEVIRRGPGRFRGQGVFEGCDFAPLQFGWILATTSDDEFRNARRAIQFAEDCRGKLPECDVLTVLAPAHAQLQDFDEAATCEEQVLKVWRSRREKMVNQQDEKGWRYKGDEAIRRHEARLELFKAGKPYFDEERTIEPQL